MVTKYETLLAIDGVTLPIASARGIKQRLEPIQNGGNFRRTVNMALRNTAPVEAKFKYRTSITCDDINAPMWDGLFLGKQVVIKCIEELFFITATGTALKSVVTGSQRVVGTVTFYRPELTMLITGFGSDGDEYEAARGWSIEAEEV